MAGSRPRRLVVVSAKTAKDGLTELPRYAVPSILAGTAVVENTLGHLSQAEGIVKLPVGEQPTVRGDLSREILTSSGGRPEGTPVSMHPSGVPSTAPRRLQHHDSQNRLLAALNRRYLGNAGLTL